MYCLQQIYLQCIGPIRESESCSFPRNSYCQPYILEPIEWPDWNQIPENTFELLRQNYQSHGFCFTTRIHLSEFIQAKFIDGDIDPKTAASLAMELLDQLGTYIQTLPSTPIFVEDKRILQTTLNRLQVRRINLISDF